MYAFAKSEKSLYIENKRDTHIRSYISIDSLNSIELAIEEYRERDDVPIEFQETLLDSNIFLINYNNVVICNDVLKTFLLDHSQNLCHIWFDNDYSDVISGNIALKELMTDLEWNWNR